MFLTLIILLDHNTILFLCNSRNGSVCGLMGSSLILG